MYFYMIFIVIFIAGCGTPPMQKARIETKKKYIGLTYSWENINIRASEKSKLFFCQKNKSKSKKQILDDGINLFELKSL